MALTLLILYLIINFFLTIVFDGLNAMGNQVNILIRVLAWIVGLLFALPIIIISSIVVKTITWIKKLK